MPYSWLGVDGNTEVEQFKHMEEKSKAFNSTLLPHGELYIREAAKTNYYCLERKKI